MQKFICVCLRTKCTSRSSFLALRLQSNNTCVGLVALVLRHYTSGGIGRVGGRARVVGLLYRALLRIPCEGNAGDVMVDIDGVVFEGTGVLVGVGDAKVFAHICADPVGRVLHAHRHGVRLVLARTWHVEVLGTRVKLHAKGKLGLLLAWSVRIIGVPRVGEIEVAWDIVLRAWHAHLLHLVTLHLLNDADSNILLRVCLDGGALTSLRGHRESSTFCGMSEMVRIVCAGTESSDRIILLDLRLVFRCKRPRGSLRWVLRAMLSR